MQTQLATTSPLPKTTLFIYYCYTMNQWFTFFFFVSKDKIHEKCINAALIMPAFNVICNLWAGCLAVLQMHPGHPTFLSRVILVRVHL